MNNQSHERFHPYFTVTLPLDVIKIRLQLDNQLAERTGREKTYSGIFRGLIRLSREEGRIALFKGFDCFLLKYCCIFKLNISMNTKMKRPAKIEIWENHIVLTEQMQTCMYNDLEDNLHIGSSQLSTDRIKHGVCCLSRLR